MKIRSNPASPSNYSKGRGGKKINKIVIHHAATTDFDGIGRTFKNPNRKASAHYGVGRKGAVDRYVSESDTAWHAGTKFPKPNPNPTSIGIENVNSTGAPNWKVAEDTFDTLVELVHDIAKRNKLLPLKVGKNLFGHKDYVATFCPGVLYGRLGELARRVNNKSEIDSSPKPKAPKKSSKAVYYGYHPYVGKSPVIGSIAKFMRKHFPAYTNKKALGDYYGPNLRKAIMTFQKRTGLVPDGVIGPKTQAKLKSYGWKG